ncbi:MAG: 4Fe-4S dicluster domain-containing protein [Thermoleophilia bacterium]|nr:4Fe-4S dicluster domain-containing protein [Gaiellaceae bacterium]MDW8339504.1 4Fe-4S dicluster domain-containing protein [Thermoleophilia bacterium]
MVAETGALSGEARVLGPDGLERLVEALREGGYRVIGPTVRDGAIVLDELSSAAELPHGWTADQEAATYRLRRREDEAVFGWAVGPHSFKQHLLPPRVRLWRARAAGRGEPPAIEVEPAPERPLALLGARPCDLHAIAIQDRVLLEGRYVERDYATRRKDALLVVVNCGVPGGSCFCTSMGTGPRAAGGYDLALTELLEGGHRFVCEVGSERGTELLAVLPTQPATAEDRAAARAVTDEAARRMGRELDTRDLPGLLAGRLEHPRFDDVAERCLSCGNCTLVCPTCFCTSVEDVNDLADGSAERWRVWDTCFSIEYSHLHGGSVRRSPRARYRQWLTHKFGTWVDQFGTSGCVGCGRCITWCPVGIDVTEELAALRTEGKEAGGAPAP